MYNIANDWKWGLAQGMLLVLLGGTAIAMPYYMTMGVALFVGWMMISVGMIVVIQAIRNRATVDIWVPLLMGLVIALLGVFMLNNLLATVLSLTMLVIIYLAMDGVYKIAFSMRLPSGTSASVVMVSGLLSLLLGIALYVGWPTTAVWFLGFVFGLNLVFSGATLITMALQSKGT